MAVTVFTPPVQTLNAASPFVSPQRLSSTTRALARRGLSGEFGRAMVPAAVALDAALASESLSEEMRYALAVSLVAATAPLRVPEEALIVGSATYLEAPLHQTPIYGGHSTSHVTPAFGKVLRMGYRGLRSQIGERLAKCNLDTKGEDLLRAMLVCIDAAQLWHDRYIALLDERIDASSGAQRAHYEDVREALLRVPEQPPTTFREAVQALWFLYAFQRLVGNWPGIGRIDAMLGPYLERDLAEGRTTLEQARELLAHFWIAGTEWIGSREWGTGDAQHYQNIVLSGVDSDGNDVTNAVTYLVLDVVEELHISDFPIAVRISRDSPERLLHRIAEVQRLGGGIVSIYNEDIILPALVRFGFSLEEARDFANDGCWEVLIQGKTAFGYMPFDLLQVLQVAMGLEGDELPVEPPDFEAVYERFEAALQDKLDQIQAWIDHTPFCGGAPATCMSMMVEGCIESGRGYHDRGARYTFLAPHAGGIADVANSLLAIRKIVYEERVLSYSELMHALRANWADHEPLRRHIRRTLPYYGNDDAEADAMMQRVFGSFTGLVARVPYRAGVHRPAGISTFGREIEWRGKRQATAHGFHAGDLLATNFSPTPGTDTHGPTAAIKSFCKMDFLQLPNGGTLELKLHPTSVKGEAGLEAMVALLKAFILLGGWYLNIDVIDSALLIEAQKHPEAYPNLAVRISGWCARFHTLSREWQDMIIQRTQHEEM